MGKRIYVVIRGLELGMQFFLYHIVACLIAGVYSGDSRGQNYYMGLLLFPLVMFAWARECVKKLSFFIVIHAAVFVGILFVGRHGAESVAFFACVMTMLVNSFVYRLSEKHQNERHLYTERPHIAMCFLFVGISFMARWMERSQMEALCYREFICFLLLYIIHENLHNTEKFLKLNEETANLPVSQMKGVGRTFLTLFLLVALAAMLLFPRLHLEVIVKGFGKMLLYLLRAFFSLFRRDNMIEEPIIEKMPMDEGGFWLEAAESSQLAVFLQELILILVQIGIVVGLFVGVSYGAYQLYKHFYKNSRKSSIDEIELIAGEVFAERIFLRRKNIKARQEKDINKKIRKLYKKYIKKMFSANDIIPIHVTPEELEQYLQCKEEKRVTLYEKARYGKVECSKEELEEMKMAVK